MGDKPRQPLIRRWLAAAAAAAAALPVAGTASAQAIVTSPGPDKVSVTGYRDPKRPAERPMNLEWLNGFALVSEVRHVAIPAGEAEIRFEGVAGGIIPESAIVSGLPDGVIEKNRDAYLLSPASLLDSSLGKRVHLRRTSRATGAVREQDAVIRSGADGAVVLQTQDGFEALRCTGLPETIIYDGLPEGLSAKPTLSVRTRSSRPAVASVTLSYLTTGLDWQANYVATLAPSGERIDLFAWVTLANGDETSFVNADTQAIAGRLNREAVERAEPEEPSLTLTCWPSATTSDTSAEMPAPPPPAAAQEIVVTAMRAPKADLAGAPAAMVVQEELGDLKLYRVPEPVTVASHSQKQVALLARQNVKVETIYRATVTGWEDDALIRPVRILKTRNRTQEGLGLPLPAGGVAVFGEGYARPVLIGEGSVDDRAVDEIVEIRAGEANGVFAHVVRTSGDDDRGEYQLTATNDQPIPVRFEAVFGGGADEIFAARGAKIGRRNGRPLWSVTIPPNGSAQLRFRLDRKS